MRTVYVDVLITVNIFIDFMLLVCTKSFLHISASLKRMILASALGGVTSLVALLEQKGFGENILLSLSGAALIVFAAFGKCKIKQFIKRTVVFFMLSFCFCGIMIFIYLSFRPAGMQIYNNIVYFNISPIVLIILTLICYFILRLAKRFTKGESGSQICEVEISLNSQLYGFKAKIDTACNVKEPFSGSYVIIAEESLLYNFSPPKSGYRVIPFTSLGGEGIIYGYRLDSLKINGKCLCEGLYLGICKNVLKGDVKAIVPYAILND